MITLEDIRSYATALPEVEEKPHFGRPGFRIRDKLFVSVHIEQDGTDAMVGVDRAEAKDAASRDPNTYEEVWRNSGQIFVGLRVDLGTVPPERLRELIELAWRNKAPKRLVAAYDDRR